MAHYLMSSEPVPTKKPEMTYQCLHYFIVEHKVSLNGSEKSDFVYQAVKRGTNGQTTCLFTQLSRRSRKASSEIARTWRTAFDLKGFQQPVHGSTRMASGEDPAPGGYRDVCHGAGQRLFCFRGLGSPERGRGGRAKKQSVG